MGYGGFNTKDWGSYKTAKHIDRATYAHEIYSTGYSGVKSEWLPYNTIRESCDSLEHPDSTPVIMALDVTGSMSYILTLTAKKSGGHNY